MAISERKRLVRDSSMTMLRATVNSQARTEPWVSSRSDGVAPRAQERLLAHVLGARTVVVGQAEAVAPQRAGVVVVQALHHDVRAVRHHTSPHPVYGAAVRSVQ